MNYRELEVGDIRDIIDLLNIELDVEGGRIRAVRVFNPGSENVEVLRITGGLSATLELWVPSTIIELKH